MYRPEVCRKINTFVEQITRLALAVNVALPSDYECYVSISANADGEYAMYYFVDHTTQTVFWLEEIDHTRHDLGWLPVCSIAHMRTYSNIKFAFLQWNP